MSAISACRTAALGGHVERCDDCGLTRIAYNSCRNRHCPKCQGATRAEWLAAREAELLPVPYSHVVFTLPPAAAEIAFRNNAPVYGLLMRTAAQALTTLAANPTRLGAGAGLIAVLHTWGQTLTTTHTSTVSSQAAASRLTARAGSKPSPTSSSPCELSRSLPSPVPRRTPSRLRQGRVALLRRSRATRRTVRFHRALMLAKARRMGRLRQAAVWRGGPSTRLSRPLHPSHCNRQFEAPRHRR